MLYHSLADEVDTHPLLANWSGQKQLLLPVVVGSDLELRLYQSSEPLLSGAYGIAEPVGSPFTDYSAIELALIPGIAFDRSGRRLGRGKGYYDRLLPRLPSAYKMGVCFPFQLVDEVPVEEFDILMDEVITCSPSKGLY